MLAATLMPSDIICNDETVLKEMKLLRYPVLASIKMDGIRALRMNMPILASRTLKWIPNEELCARALSLPVGYDMELWSPSLEYNEIQSTVMTEKANADEIEFHVFDDYKNALSYSQRVLDLSHRLYNSANKWHFFQPAFCIDSEELFAFEKYAIETHSEGICFRTPDSPYKQGRSTLKEQYLVKHCRWVYEECVITGFKEQMFNANKDKRNAVNKMDRSKSILGMVPKNTLGAFTVINKHRVTFDVGNGEGLIEALRKVIWDNKQDYLGKTIIVKSKAHGVKNKPRSPIFWGFREEGY